MNRLTQRLLLSTGLLAAVHSAPIYAATDWIENAVGTCEVTLGSAQAVGPALKATVPAVVQCPLTKQLGSSNLTAVYVRVKETSTANGSLTCNLISKDSFNQAGSVTSKTVTRNGTQSLSMPIPALYSSGYLSLLCVLRPNDQIYGFRYKQN